MADDFPIRVFGGPTALFSYGGLRFLTDPTFDEPGDYDRGGGRVLTKTAPPAGSLADVGHVDVVLLSHDEHPDNLDRSGRAMLADVPLVLTTPSGAERLGATALADWASVEVGGVVRECREGAVECLVG
jgi:L-ascorbate metabolism protein UlaG (beta-lactamase superfamily)